MIASGARIFAVERMIPESVNKLERRKVARFLARKQLFEHAARPC
jgi:hypothetical protein